MSNLSELYDKLNSLPLGNISKKKINGNLRYYFQYKEKGKLISKYIKDGELPYYEKLIKQKQEIKKEISLLEKEVYSSTCELSKNKLSLTGYLMHKDEVIAYFENGNFIYGDLKKAPILIQRTKDIRLWLSRRAIDSHRTNSRKLKKVLRIKQEEDEYVALSVNGATIIDSYWFKGRGSPKKYKDIKFKNDFYSDLSISGEIGNTKFKSSITPELTLGGSFEKCWKLINGKWWMYKVGTKEEIFSEIFTYHLGKYFGFNMARYELDGKYIKTLNFASNYDFEPISSIVGSNDDYEYVFKNIAYLGEDVLKDYLKIIFLDSLVFNVDRHSENFGLLKDKKTFKIISLAPNYDNNMSLLVNGISSRKNDQMIKIFKDFLSKNDKAYNLYKSLKIKNLDKNILSSIIEKIGMEVDKEKIIDFILEGYNMLVK